MKPIVVLGSLNADLVSRSARLPATGETVTGSGFAVYPGGKGANQAVAAGKLGAEVRMLGAVGDDAFGAMLVESLSNAGVHAGEMDRVAGTSGVALINTDDSGRNRIVVVPGANALVTIDYVTRHRETIQNASVLLLQLEVPLESVVLAASLAKEAGVPVILDPAPAPAHPLPLELLQCVTWLTPNDSEADALLGGDKSSDRAMDSEARTQSLLALGVKNVLLKRGESGAAIATSDGGFSTLGAFSVSVVDTTAAGDAFNAGFAVALAQGKEPAEALRFAMAVAAISVTRAGAQPSMPTSQEVQALLLAP